MEREERHMRPCASLSFFLLILSFLPNLSSTQASSLGLGGIVDYGSREGREERVAMEMAIDDFCAHSGRSCCPTLLVNDSLGDPLQTAFLASSIVKDHNARAIFLGTESWQITLIVAELGNKYQVPVLSLANQAPNRASHHLPFLVNAARSQHAEMKAVAAIIRSWKWQKVNVIYEDIGSAVAGIIPHLIEAIQDAGSEISTLLSLPTFQPNISEKLESLKSKQCRVFIVHANSITLVSKIFKEAKKLGIMEADSVWITTTSITNQIDYLDASAISSMEGVIGVGSYFPESGKRFERFHSKFIMKYGLQYPHEKNLEPGIFAVQAYDAAWAVAIALASNVTAGKELLDRSLQHNFSGLSGRFRFNFSTKMLDPAHMFEIINVGGRSYRELGFWSEGLGFSTSVDKGSNYSTSMRILGQVVWPGRPWTVPRGWEVAKSSKPLRIAVPANTTFTEFVNVKYDDEGKQIVEGYAIDVFNATVKLLPYDLPYKLVPLSSPSYDSMVQQVALEVFDGVVADTAIIANRCSYAEFSQPYADSGLQMLIYFKPKRLERAWLFLKPFTARLWIVTVAANIYSGFVIWFIERKQNPDRYINESMWNQIGTMFSSTFNTLFSQHGPKLSVNSSRIALIVWLFIGLVITTSYTASLTTLLTVQQLEPAKVDIETLKKMNAKVGCDGNSFVVKYLEEALGFRSENIVKIRTGEEYFPALESGKISAAFLEVPYVKLLLSKYCSNLITSGPTLKVGGFGFAFPRSSPYLPDISHAILMLTENGKLLNMEKAMLDSHKCSSSSSGSGNESGRRLDIDSYLGLFIITAVTSSLALFFYFFSRREEVQQCINPKISQDIESPAPERPPDGQASVEMPALHGDRQEANDHGGNAGQSRPEILDLGTHDEETYLATPLPRL